MARPVDWSPLAETDPVPGDPVRVDELSRRYRETATTISQQAAALRQLCTDDYWDSDAGREFRNRSDELAGKLEDAFERYDAAATALRNYKPELEEAQRIADAALGVAREAERVHSQQVREAELAGPPANPPSQPVMAPAVPDHPDLGPARDQLAGAVRIRDSAARTAADAIGRVIDGDDVKDSWTDKFKGWVQDHADLLGKISTWASRIAIVCGVLSLAVGWIPIVGQAVAGILTTIAVAATAVGLICDTMLALAGEGSWLSVGIDVIGLVSFGIGRAAISGGAASARAARGVVHQTVMAAGRSGRPLAGRAMNRLFLAAKRASGGLTPHEAKLAVGAAPGRGVPSLGQFASGMNPVQVVRDNARAVTGAVSDFRAWRAGDLGGDALRWSRPWRFDAPLAHAMDDARSVLGGTAGVPARAADFMGDAATAGRTWVAANVAGIAPPTLDQFGLFNRAKSATTAGVL